MDKRIFIIHPSLIIRQGIIALIKSRPDWDYIDVADCAEATNYRTIRNNRLVFIVDEQLPADVLATTLSHFRELNTLKTLHLCNGYTTTRQTHLTLNVTKDQFIQVIDEQFGTDGKGKLKQAEQPALTERERDILKQVALGKSNKEMAHLLSISIHTVISHRKNITEKLNIKSISGLTVYAILNKLLDTENIDPESLI